MYCTSSSYNWLIHIVYFCQESILRATQYLPGIVQLQQQMYDISHHKLDRKEASQKTARDFIEKSLKSGTSSICSCKLCRFHLLFLLLLLPFFQEHKRKLFLHNLACVRNAWSLVKEKLSEYCKYTCTLAELSCIWHLHICKKCAFTVNLIWSTYLTYRQLIEFHLYAHFFKIAIVLRIRQIINRGLEP